MNVIEAKNVSIRYITGDLKNIGLKEYVMRKIKGDYHVVEFWADKDINFSLKKGDMLGIIGTNGAGKSTLLKALSGVMKPTKGALRVRGSVAAILELASGFDGNMTVKENAYLRGAMLGYTREFMDQQYGDIISFAELEEFQDTLFKNLSSGMKSRLAFAIACLVNPDIIILDEVLSVGDGAFKQKSFQRMKEILSSGVTGILVSHSIKQVREMCTKILWLDHGRQVGFSDKVQLFCDAYENFLRTGQLPENEAAILAWDAQRQQERLRIKEERETRARAIAEERARKQAEDEAKEREKKEREAVAKKERETLLQRQREEREARRKEQQQRLMEQRNLEELARLAREKELFSLQALCTNPGSNALTTEIVTKYLQNCTTARIELQYVGAYDNAIAITECTDANAFIEMRETDKGEKIYCIESSEETFGFKCQCAGPGELWFTLSGRPVYTDAGSLIPVWITYTDLYVQNQVKGIHALIHNRDACFDHPFQYGRILQEDGMAEVSITHRCTLKP